MRLAPQKLQGRIDVKLSIIENQKLFLLNSDKHNEYSYLLNKIFLYADQEGIPESDDSIGNSMRKVLEGFHLIIKKGLISYLTH